MFTGVILTYPLAGILADSPDFGGWESIFYILGMNLERYTVRIYSGIFDHNTVPYFTVMGQITFINYDVPSENKYTNLSTGKKIPEFLRKFTGIHREVSWDIFLFPGFTRKSREVPVSLPGKLENYRISR